MKKLAVLLVLAAGTLWGAIGIFVRHYTALGLSSMQIVALRLVLAAVMFSVFLLFYDRRLFKIRLRDLWCFLGTGIVSLSVFSFFYFKSIELSSLSVAAVLLYTAPAFVMLFSLALFKERMTVPKVISLVLAVFGCAMTTGVIGGDIAVTLPGFLFGLGSGICYALYSIFSRFALNRGYAPFTINLYTFLFAAVTSLITIDVRPVVSVMTASAGEFGLALLFALLSCVLPYVTYTLGLRYISSSTASIIATVEPIVATVIGAVIFSEPIGVPFGYIGVGLVFLSVVLINLKFGKRTEKKDA